jgi:diguanylate cyclase (GGDEF)-like protein/PAS domain S-box-containing protein
VECLTADDRYVGSDQPPCQTPARKRHSLLTQIAVVCTALSLIVLGMFVALVRANAEREAADRGRDRSARLETQSHKVERLVIELDTGVHGYALTHDQRLLTPWREARRVLPGELAELRRLVTNPRQRATARRISREIDSFVEQYSGPFVAASRRLSGRELEAFAWEGRARIAILRGLFIGFHDRHARLALVRDRRAKDAAARLTTIVWSLMAVGMVSLLGFAGFVLFAVVRPVRRITLAVDALSNGRRDLDVRVRGRGELARLSAGINHAAGALAAHEQAEKRAAAALRASEARYRAVVDSIDEVVFQTDLQGVWTFLSPAWARMTGYAVEDLIGRDASWIVHPEDIGQARSALAGLADGTRPRAGFEVRYIDASGNTRWVTVDAHRTVDGGTGEQAIGGLMRDVTELREAQAGLRRHADGLAAVAEVARVLPTSGDARTAITRAAVEVSGAVFAVLIEPDGDRFASTAMSGVSIPGIRFGREEQSTTAHVFRSGQPAFIADGFSSPHLAQHLLTAVGARAALWQPVIKDGATVAVLAVAWPHVIDSPSDHQAAVIALLAAEAAVAIERADLLVRLEDMARTDALTGLANRRVWDEQLANEMARAKRHGYPLAVALLDIDHFKALNDEHGHHAGDRLLVDAAAAWSADIRDGDVLARWGGEEFVLALPACGLDDGIALLEHLRALVPGGQTCSAGVAQWDGSETADRLLARADAALYRAKETGRDRTVADRAVPALA